MTAREILVWGSERLRAAKIVSASLDAEILLACALKKTKEFLAAHPECPVNRSRLTAYRKLIGRRAKHEPVAYITGRKEFYGLDFSVDCRVLIPRPETELMVEEVLKLITPPILPLSGERLSKILPLIRGGQRGLEGIHIIDIGTGSGCIAISLAKLLTTHYKLPTRFFATDASATALARRNARLHGVEKNITFLRGNLLEPVFKIRNFANSQFRNFIITANLPYLPTAEWRRTPPDVKNYEPRLALDGGLDGLKYYRLLLKQLKEVGPRVAPAAEVRPRTVHLLLEICPHQSDDIQTLACFYFPDCHIEIKKDLAGRKRLAVVSL